MAPTESEGAGFAATARVRMCRDMTTTYALDGGIATITLDDGKVNALSPQMSAAVMGELDRAEQDGAVVVLTGRAATFSAGFDLRVPAEEWPEMLVAGARLARRLVGFPRPTVIACNGNAIAMGAFLLLSADLRIGAPQGRIGLNEVAIGLTVPWFGIALAEHRLTTPGYHRALVTGAVVAPDEAVALGFLDQTAPDPLAAAHAAAAALKGIDMNAHAGTKERVRAPVIAALDEGIERLERGEP